MHTDYDLKFERSKYTINKVVYKLKVPKRTKFQENISDKIILKNLNKINKQMLNHLGFACTKKTIIPVASSIAQENMFPEHA